jgi:hypothetical protein
MKHSVLPHIIKPDKKFLLTDRKRERLYFDGQHLVEVEFIENGNLAVSKVNIQGRIRRISMGKMSLSELSARYLESEDPTEILKYMVSPFSEVERIFNSIRYKWCKAILKGKKESQEYAGYNALFRVLAGFPLRNDPKGIRARKLALAEGFNVDALPLMDISREKQEMKVILKYLFDVFSSDLPGLYRELIAIKPAFHEIWADDNWLDEGEGHIDGLRDIPYRDRDRRSQVLSELHGLTNPAPRLDMTNVIYEIAIPAYLTYAPCAINQGPCFIIYRNDISCYQLLRDRENVNLNDYFLVYDYYDMPITEKELEILKRFQHFNCID